MSVRSIVEKYNSKTRMGMIPNMKKSNQDSQLIVKDLAGIKGLWLFGVMDGHGVNGHLVSDMVKKYFPIIMSNIINGVSSAKSDPFNPRGSMNSGKQTLKKSVGAASRNV